MSGRARGAIGLGSGGARGYAHIGVLEILEERGYEVVSVAGLSTAGRLDDSAAWARGLTQRDVLRLLDPAFRGPGAIRATKILAKVTDLVSGIRIVDLPITYTAVATDLLAGKAVHHGVVQQRP